MKNQNVDLLRPLDDSMAQSWIVAISDDDEEIEEGGEEIDDESATKEDIELHKVDYIYMQG